MDGKASRPLNSTMFFDGGRTAALDGRPAGGCPPQLLHAYQELITGDRFSWTAHHRFVRPLGSGGQGVVFLAERRGADAFTMPVALKFFTPDRYPSAHAYDEAMRHAASVAARVAQIQQDNLLDVHNLVDRNRIRVMEMEWVDGYDLSRLLTHDMLQQTYERVSARRWEYLTNVVFAHTEYHPRFKPGIAMAIVRGCLAGLAALHRQDIVHGDLKPANIMIKRTGTAKLIDIGSAHALNDPPATRMCTPTAAAPEVLEGGDSTPRSDLASLGYVLIEMLSGRPPFEMNMGYRDLLDAKRSLPRRLHEYLPDEVTRNELLMNFCRQLTSPDPMTRFPDAEAADLYSNGAASFHRQLIKGDLASEFENELRLWLGDLA